MAHVTCYGDTKTEKGNHEPNFPLIFLQENDQKHDILKKNHQIHVQMEMCQLIFHQIEVEN